MTAITARPILMRSQTGPERLTVPAGTEVYARPRRNGDSLMIRLPGTLFTQHVYPSALLVP